jgi:hypothetical protein
MWRPSLLGATGSRTQRCRNAGAAAWVHSCSRGPVQVQSDPAAVTAYQMPSSPTLRPIPTTRLLVGVKWMELQACFRRKLMPAPCWLPKTFLQPLNYFSLLYSRDTDRAHGHPVTWRTLLSAPVARGRAEDPPLVLKANSKCPERLSALLQSSRARRSARTLSATPCVPSAPRLPIHAGQGARPRAHGARWQHPAGLDAGPWGRGGRATARRRA